MPHASAFDVEAGEEVVGVTYEAKPLRTAFTKPEPWWAFLISYGNFRLSIVTFFFWGSCVAFHQAATSYTLYRGTMVHRGVCRWLGSSPLSALHTQLCYAQRASPHSYRAAYLLLRLCCLNPECPFCLQKWRPRHPCMTWVMNGFRTHSDIV